MRAVFASAEAETLRVAQDELPTLPKAVRLLDARAKRVLGMFTLTEQITSNDVASELGLSTRMARLLLKRWVEDGWLKVADPSRRNRAYGLSAIFRQYIGNPTAMG